MALKAQGNGSPKRETHAESQNFHAAFTLIELLVVVAILFIVAGMVPVSFSRSGEKARRIKCVNNLKNVGLAFRLYTTDNYDLFPWQSTNQLGQIQTDFAKDPYFYFLRLRNELSTPLLLHCPSDSRPRADDWTNFTRSNISYFISQDASETYPQSFLAGDRNVATNNIRLNTGIHRLDSGSDVGWDDTQHKQQGDACMSDGSVQQLGRLRFKENFRNTGLTNITLAIP